MILYRDYENSNLYQKANTLPSDTKNRIFSYLDNRQKLVSSLNQKNINEICSMIENGALLNYEQFFSKQERIVHLNHGIHTTEFDKYTGDVKNKFFDLLPLQPDLKKILEKNASHLLFKEYLFTTIYFSNTQCFSQALNELNKFEKNHEINDLLKDNFYTDALIGLLHHENNDFFDDALSLIKDFNIKTDFKPLKDLNMALVNQASWVKYFEQYLQNELIGKKEEFKHSNEPYLLKTILKDFQYYWNSNTLKQNSYPSENIAILNTFKKQLEKRDSTIVKQFLSKLYQDNFHFNEKDIIELDLKNHSYQNVCYKAEHCDNSSRIARYDTILKLDEMILIQQVEKYLSYHGEDKSFETFKSLNINEKFYPELVQYMQLEKALPHESKKLSKTKKI